MYQNAIDPANKDVQKMFDSFIENNLSPQKQIDCATNYNLDINMTVSTNLTTSEENTRELQQLLVLNLPSFENKKYFCPSGHTVLKVIDYPAKRSIRSSLFDFYWRYDFKEKN
jgi:hypothetical protein